MLRTIAKVSEYIHFKFTLGSPPGLWVGLSGASVSILRSTSSSFSPSSAWVQAMIPACSLAASFFSTFQQKKIILYWETKTNFAFINS